MKYDLHIRIWVKWNIDVFSKMVIKGIIKEWWAPSIVFYDTIPKDYEKKGLGY